MTSLWFPNTAKLKTFGQNEMSFHTADDYRQVVLAALTRMELHPPLTRSRISLEPKANRATISNYR